jgi:hypothetical protein
MALSLSFEPIIQACLLFNSHPPSVKFTVPKHITSTPW